MSFTREFTIDESKQSYAQWHVEIDLNSWIDTEKIESVNVNPHKCGCRGRCIKG